MRRKPPYGKRRKKKRPGLATRPLSLGDGTTGPAARLLFRARTMVEPSQGVSARPILSCSWLALRSLYPTRRSALLVPRSLHALFFHPVSGDQWAPRSSVECPGLAEANREPILPWTFALLQSVTPPRCPHTAPVDPRVGPCTGPALPVSEPKLAGNGESVLS